MISFSVTAKPMSQEMMTRKDSCIKEWWPPKRHRRLGESVYIADEEEGVASLLSPAPELARVTPHRGWNGS